MTSRHCATSNQRWNNVVYINVEIYDVQQRWNNVVYFNVELNNGRQRRNNIVVFNVDFHNVGQRRNNMNMPTSIKSKKTLCVVTIAVICSNLASLWKFQYFRRPIYNPVEHLWWSFYCKNKAVKYIHKKSSFAWEFQQACKYVHQILTVNKLNIRLLITVHLIPL